MSSVEHADTNWSLRLIDACRTSQQGQTLLEDISIELHPGSRVGVRGASGSGKSTLLRLLSKLDPLSSGQLLWNERTVNGSDVPAYRAKVLYAGAAAFRRSATVEVALQRPFDLAVRSNRKYDANKIASYLEQLDLPPKYLSTELSRLSTGESNLFRLMRALQLEPTVLLLDEPTLGLDGERRHNVEGLLQDWLRQESKRAIVVVSHEHDLLSRLTDSTLELQDGKVVGQP